MENELQNEKISMPLISDDTPAFKAVTTIEPINFPEDYVGKWTVLFSHPANSCMYLQSL